MKKRKKNKARYEPIKSASLICTKCWRVQVGPSSLQPTTPEPAICRSGMATGLAVSGIALLEYDCDGLLIYKTMVQA